MRHWTQDGAHLVGYAALAGGGVGMTLTSAWPPTVVAVAGIVLLIAIRVLESYDGWKQATDALAKVQAHEDRLAKAEKDADEAKKQAASALNGVRISSAKPPQF